MDFLDIRKKAKQRAQARAAEAAAAAPEPAADAQPPPARPSPPDAPVVTDDDVLEGALAARLQGLPAPEAQPFGLEPAVADARFTTWRPGSGAPPALAPEPERAEDPAPRPED